MPTAVAPLPANWSRGPTGRVRFRPWSTGELELELSGGWGGSRREEVEQKWQVTDWRLRPSIAGSTRA